MRETNPFILENPEFCCTELEDYPLRATLAISHSTSGDKSNRFSTLTFGTDHSGGYPMRVSFRIDEENHWFAQDKVNEICIQFAGDYEAGSLVYFFQHVGAMLTATYGTPT